MVPSCFPATLYAFDGATGAHVAAVPLPVADGETRSDSRSLKAGLPRRQRQHHRLRTGKLTMPAAGRSSFNPVNEVVAQQVVAWSDLPSGRRPEGVGRRARS
jgi:hypothetical protein